MIKNGAPWLQKDISLTMSLNKFFHDTSDIIRALLNTSLNNLRDKKYFHNPRNFFLHVSRISKWSLSVNYSHPNSLKIFFLSIRVTFTAYRLFVFIPTTIKFNLKFHTSQRCISLRTDVQPEKVSG